MRELGRTIGSEAAEDALCRHPHGCHATVHFRDGSVVRGGVVYREETGFGAIIVPPDAGSGGFPRTETGGARYRFHISEIHAVRDADRPKPGC